MKLPFILPCYLLLNISASCYGQTKLLSDEDSANEIPPADSSQIKNASADALFAKYGFVVDYDRSYDWYPKEELPEELLKLVRPGCEGLYIDPLTDPFESETPNKQNKTPQKKKSVLQSPTNPNQENVIVEADIARVEDGKMATLSGAVAVTQGDMSLTSDTISYDRESDTAKLEGNVTVRQPNVLIRGKQARVNFKDDTSSFEGAEFIIHTTHLRGSAESIGQIDEDTIELRGGMLTSCEPNHAGWSLEGEKITVNQTTRQGEGHNVKLKIADVPVFYFPYITFPVGDERKSGFLFPVTGASSGGGLDVALPYYWNIAPNADATITPRVLTNHGFMIETETRHVNQWIRSELGASFLPNDRDERSEIDTGTDNNSLSDSTPPSVNSVKGEDRWLLALNQVAGDTTGWYLNTDFTKVSDTDYFRDIGASSFTVRNNSQLNQIIRLGYQNTHWDFSTLVESHQLLLQDVENTYDKLPQLKANGFFQKALFSASLNHEYTQFKNAASKDAIEGGRLVLDYRVRWDNQKTWGFATPEIGIKSLNYRVNGSQTEIAEDTQEQSYNAPQASFDAGLLFERYGESHVQTFEPRVYYLYRKFIDQSDLYDANDNGDNINFDTYYRTFSYNQLFRDSRFIGSDRLDDANQFTAGISTRTLDANDYQEKMRFSFGKIYYFDQRKIFLNSQIDDNEDNLDQIIVDSSETALETAFFANRSTQIILNAIYNTELNRTTRSTARLHYASSEKANLFNLSYTQRNPVEDSTGDIAPLEVLEQADASTVWQVSPQWALIGKYNYDLRNQRELESFGGFEYDDCCYRFQLLARRWLDSNIANLENSNIDPYDRGIFFEFQLKGLGGIGEGTKRILNDGIFGYREREKNKQHTR